MAERAILHADHAALTAVRAGQPYRPSNGTEGEIFEAAWCTGCRRQQTADGNGCLIALKAWAYDLGDEGYPTEWRYGPDGQPACTAFSDKHAPHKPYRCKRTVDLLDSFPRGSHVR